MEELFLDICPDFYDEIGAFALSLGEFFAGGLLISFLFWVLGFTIRELFMFINREVVNVRG